MRQSDEGARDAGLSAADGDLIDRLERTERFRVLRAVPELPRVPAVRGALAGSAIAVVVDVETTGLDPATAEVIELGMVRFAYDKRDGRVLGVEDTFAGLRQPWAPIPAAVTRLTGIDDEMVAGHEIDGEEVARFVGDAALVVAHNARFDRPFVEGRWPGFAKLPWACSCTEVDWSAEGYDGARLGHLLMQAGYFHEAHRAVDDATALLHLLALPLATSGRTGLAALLDTARTPTWRIWAERAPYEAKDRLKSRGYRWSNGALGLPRAWYRDLPEDAIDREVEFLEADVFWDGQGRPLIVPLTALDRFTARAGSPRALQA